MSHWLAPGVIHIWGCLKSPLCAFVLHFVAVVFNVKSFKHKGSLRASQRNPKVRTPIFDFLESATVTVK
jgi:hypothetical protein